jgi:8-oxo-dGTP pyrophosphatase MutT (NUDIX family)
MRRAPFLHKILVRVLHATAARSTIGVNGVVFNQQGQVLLLEHVFRSRYPWGLPGGWVGRRERPQDALQREMMEEVGLAIQVGPPVMVEPGELPGHLETGFLCEVEDQAIGPLSGEILSARWVFPETLPDGLYRTDREMILQALALRSKLSAEQAVDEVM